MAKREEKMNFCKKQVGAYKHLCTKPHDHKGACSHKFYASQVLNNKVIKDKTLLDVYSTPGDQKSVKNRADRCYPVQATSDEVAQYNQDGLKSYCIRKKFSSTPEDCFSIHIDLVNDAAMIEGGKFKNENANLYDQSGNQIYPNNPILPCAICGDEILADHYLNDASESTHVNIGHMDPGGKDQTAHKAGNIKLVHRHCNIIQGDQTIQTMLNQLEKIISFQKSQVK